VVDNYARRIEQWELSPEEVVAAAQEIQAASGRVMELLRTVLDYARGSSSYKLQPLPLTLVVSTALQQVQHEIDEQNIRVERELDVRRSLSLDPQHMDRALTNLLVNALEAMPDGGTLTITTRSLESGEVELVVADTGKGIAVERLGQIFEPFVTHGKARGIGLGLAIVKQIVDNHDAQIRVESTPGSGTAFTITFPATVTE